MRGQTRWSPVLVQRAVSEDPRWTRAVGDLLARPQGRRWKSGGRMGQGRVLARPGWAGEKMRAVKGSLGHSFKEMYSALEEPR